MTKRQDKNYQGLLNRLRRIYEGSLIMGVEAQRQKKVETFLEMGETILAAQLDDDGNAKYGDAVMKRIAQDFTAQYGGGFKERNMYYITEFARQYDAENLNPEFSWNHYKSLIGVRDKARREQLARALEARFMPAKQFEKYVRRVLAGEQGDADPNVNYRKLLVPRTARVGIVKLRRDPFGDGACFIDLGFGVALPLAKALVRGINDKQYLEVDSALFKRRRMTSAAAAINPDEIKEINCEAGERYCYDGVVQDVVDGDTVRVRLHLGFGITTSQRLRLRSVAAQEMGEHGAEPAKAAVLGRVPPGTQVRVLTYSHDVYGRYVGDVFFGARSHERFLNVELLELGVANFVDARS